MPTLNKLVKLAVLASLCAAPVIAAPALAATPAMPALPAIPVAPQTCANATADLADAYVGSYALADGRLLTISEDGGTLYAQVGPRAPVGRNARFDSARRVALVPSGPGRFVARNAPIQFAFDVGAAGADDTRMASVRLSAPANDREMLARR